MITDDKVTRVIGEYLRDKLNELNDIPNTILIRSIVNYDKFNVPIIDLPLLKVSRIRSSHLKSDRLISTIAVDYHVIANDLDRVASFTKYLSDNINKYIGYIKEDKNIYVDKSSRNTDYRVTMIELQPVILRLLRITFNITEGEYD